MIHITTTDRAKNILKDASFYLSTYCPNVQCPTMDLNEVFLFLLI